jgi:PAS domain S-box-containing protein
MAETESTSDSMDEVQALRARIAELERQLGGYRHGEDLRVSEPSSADAMSDGRERAAEKAVEGFFDQPLVMMFIADLVEGRFLRINQKVCDVLGLTEREILESSFLDRVHPDDIPRTMREMGRLAAGERSTNFKNRHLGADGTYHVFKWTSVADADRELCYAMAIEVTENDA